MANPIVKPLSVSAAKATYAAALNTAIVAKFSAASVVRSANAGATRVFANLVKKSVNGDLDDLQIVLRAGILIEDAAVTQDAE